MAQTYPTVAQYVTTARLLLQDEIAPYRYPDDTIITSLNVAMNELGRLRPDILLDLKYQSPLIKGDIDDGVPGPYTATDIASGTLVPVPVKYRSTIDWFVSGWAQMLDVADTQDQRGQGFMAKFSQHLITLSAA